MLNRKLAMLEVVTQLYDAKDKEHYIVFKDNKATYYVIITLTHTYVKQSKSLLARILMPFTKPLISQLSDTDKDTHIATPFHIVIADLANSMIEPDNFKNIEVIN